IGIGSNFFAELAALIGPDPDTSDAMTLLLGALSLMGLGIFGPGIASGLVSGAPQLGAGAAVGTAAGAAIMAGGAGLIGARAAMAAASGGMKAIRAGTAMGSAASTSYRLGQATSGNSTVAAGLGGIASTAGGAAAQGARDGLARRSSIPRQRRKRPRFCHARIGRCERHILHCDRRLPCASLGTAPAQRTECPTPPPHGDADRARRRPAGQRRQS